VVVAVVAVVVAVVVVVVVVVANGNQHFGSLSFCHTHMKKTKANPKKDKYFYVIDISFLINFHSIPFDFIRFHVYVYVLFVFSNPCNNWDPLLAAVDNTNTGACLLAYLLDLRVVQSHSL
jgi:hypothetical protein